MKISEVKEIDIVAFLRRLGYHPVRINSSYALFHAPYRVDNHPSLRVNRNHNKWLDYATGQRGDIIDLGKLLFQCDNITDVMRKITDERPIISLSSRPAKDKSGNQKTFSNIRIQELTNKKLLSYLDSRGIDLSIGTRFCEEIYYSLKSKRYFALAFKNISGGYEIRNPYFKGAISPKDISIITTGISNSYCMVFEGFMDFLSYKTLNLKADFSFFSETVDYLILNSTSNLNRALSFIKKYELVACCLDNDEAGRKAVDLIASEHNGVHDMSEVYHDFKDLNDFIRNRPILKSMNYDKNI